MEGVMDVAAKDKVRGMRPVHSIYLGVLESWRLLGSHNLYLTRPCQTSETAMLLFNGTVGLKKISEQVQKGLNMRAFTTEPIAYSDSVGKWEKCHCNQIVTVSKAS